jgi:hypothetical protein
LKEQDLRSLAFVLAGAFFAFIPTMLTLPPFPVWWFAGSITVLFALIGVALLYGTGLLQDYAHRRRLSARWKGTLRAGILNDSGWNLERTDTYAWTDVRPENWKSQLEQSTEEGLPKLSPELIRVSSHFDSYAIILNPYGGVYPEEDLANFTSLRKIIDFVREGGLFVNVADIPSFWAYNQDLNRRLAVAQTVYATDVSGGGIQII